MRQKVKNLTFWYFLLPGSTKKHQKVRFLTFCLIRIYHRSILEKPDKILKIHWLAKFCFCLMPKMLNFEGFSTTAWFTITDFDLAKKWQNSSNLSILLHKEVKVPKSKVFHFLPHKNLPSIYFRKNQIKFSKSAC